MITHKTSVKIVSKKKQPMEEIPRRLRKENQIKLLIWAQLKSRKKGRSQLKCAHLDVSLTIYLSWKFPCGGGIPLPNATGWYQPPLLSKQYQQTLHAMVFFCTKMTKILGLKEKHSLIKYFICSLCLSATASAASPQFSGHTIFQDMEFSRPWKFPSPGNFHGVPAGLAHGNFQALEITMGWAMEISMGANVAILFLGEILRYKCKTFSSVYNVHTITY